jgi:hypothetical protein
MFNLSDGVLASAVAVVALLIDQSLSRDGFFLWGGEAAAIREPEAVSGGPCFA